MRRRRRRRADMDAPSIRAHGRARVAAALAAHGVRFVFTLCGGHVSPTLVAAKARGLRVLDTRDEATAVFAADAVARLFFFHAEAGIRDGTVTGVQTCALPIFTRSRDYALRGRRSPWSGPES